MPEYHTEISVVLPVYNRMDDVVKCLGGLLGQMGCSFEIIVVNDASTDGDYHSLCLMADSISVHTNCTNAGPAFSRNIAINIAKGRYILFLDSDTLFPCADSLSNLLSFFREHPDTGTVGGELRVYENSSTQVYGRLISNDGMSRSMHISNTSHAYAETDFLATCCCMVPAELARKVGGFDPYYVFGSEDKDFGYNIQQLGYKNYVAADCAVAHYHSPRGRNPDETYRYQLTRFRFAFKHYSIINALLISIKCIMQFFLFYLFIPGKLLFFALSGKPIVKENLIGGYLLVKALNKCIFSYAKIRKSRGTNFLAAEEMERFLAWRRGEK